jgi:hypothetical protein
MVSGLQQVQQRLIILSFNQFNEAGIGMPTFVSERARFRAGIEEIQIWNVMLLRKKLHRLGPSGRKN